MGNVKKFINYIDEVEKNTLKKSKNEEYDKIKPALDKHRSEFREIYDDIFNSLKCYDHTEDEEIIDEKEDVLMGKLDSLHSILDDIQSILDDMDDIENDTYSKVESIYDDLELDISIIEDIEFIQYLLKKSK